MRNKTIFRFIHIAFFTLTMCLNSVFAQSNPSPRIYEVICDGQNITVGKKATVQPGHEFWFTVKGTNLGDNFSGHGNIAISVDGFDDVLNYSSDISATKVPKGGQIYDVNGQPMTAQDVYIEGEDTYWTNHEGHWLGVYIKAPLMSTYFDIFARVTFSDNNWDVVDQDPDLWTGSTDQQGFKVYKYRILVQQETISTPNTPTGPSSGKVGQSLSFSTGGSSSNLGHTVEYQFDWGDGTQSGWGSSSQNHSYSSTGTKYVKARARCQTHTSVTSSWSSSKSVTISYCQLSVSVNPSGVGIVNKSPDKTNFSYNETVQLAANANSGYEFDHWEGDLSGNNNPASLTMNDDKNITAYFNQVLETVSTPSILSAPSNGKVGQNLSFITGGAVSNLGHHLEYRFDWGDENISAWGDSSQNHAYINIGPYVVKSIARCQVDTNIVSTWSSGKTITISGHTLEVSINPVGSGSVLKSIDKEEYNHNEIVILAAKPNDEYQFDHWGNDLTGVDNPDTLKMDNNKIIVANFSTFPDTTPPFVSDFSPAKEDTNVSINANIVVHIKDDSSGVDTTSIVMQVNLKQVDPKISGNQKDVVLIYDSPIDFGYEFCYL